MLEIIIFFLALLVIMLIGMRPEVVKSYPEIKVAEKATSENKFLEQLQQKVEVTIFPRPSDATLNRHYNALIKEKLDTHLSSMPNS